MKDKDVLKQEHLLTGDKLTFYRDSAGKEVRINVQSAGNHETILPLEGYADLAGAEQALMRVAAPLKAWVEAKRHAGNDPRRAQANQGPLCGFCASAFIRLGTGGWTCLDCGRGGGDDPPGIKKDEEAANNDT